MSSGKTSFAERQCQLLRMMDSPQEGDRLAAFTVLGKMLHNGADHNDLFKQSAQRMFSRLAENINGSGGGQSNPDGDGEITGALAAAGMSRAQLLHWITAEGRAYLAAKAREAREAANGQTCDRTRARAMVMFLYERINRLNTWERGFVENLHTVTAKPGHYLSEKQLDKLQTIYRQHGGIAE